MAVLLRARRAWRHAAAATLVFGTVAFAGADSATDSLEACRNLADGADRLACYDRIPLQTTKPATRAAPEPVATSARPTKAPDTPPVPRAAPATEASPADGNMVQRGLGRLRSLFGRDEPAVEKPPELDSIEAQVVKFVELPRGNHSLTLEDGQVWREIEVKRRARYRVGDAVVIARGALGSYNLSSERTGHRVKVRRIR